MSIERKAETKPPKTKSKPVAPRDWVPAFGVFFCRDHYSRLTPWKKGMVDKSRCDIIFSCGMADARPASVREMPDADHA